ncbi:ExbD/TolR family protein [Spirochaeta africana]|uniref:Biopolymer transport protein n=1 Tax=Spirochaeta africana (strain ATCC 700263 / DSM 8902 / Z-7692) TaxID=889378 RepID=H9ULH7_SPIAZ|nr:biopolymer transporter ExbD [Spirochaeta africana]AFG38370.1 biopolymer transport protein [Spirochaeta africana DSM 8902]
MGLRKSRRGGRIAISAMSDIAFLLLIFIMLVALIDYRQEVRIEYPEAAGVELTQADANLEIWVDQEGGIYLDGIPVEPSAMEGRIVEVFLDNPATRIHIIADRRTSYRHVHGVIETLQLLQHRVVSFVVHEAGQ